MGERFVAAYPNLIRALNGDVIAALTLQAINYRSNIIKPDENGEIWVDLRIPEIANEIGISSAQTQRALQRLRDKSLLVETQAPGYNNKKLWMIDETGLDELEKNALANVPERITNNAPANNYKFDSEKSSISKEVIKNNKNTLGEFPQEAIEHAHLLADLIEAKGVKRPKVTSNWYRDIDKIQRLDGYSWEQIESTIRWISQDKFWYKVILSPSKLREKMIDLQLRMNESNGTSGGLSGWARVIEKFQNDDRQIEQ